MKSFRKALAVLLSVLMVVFSFPLSALALENPNQTEDGMYADDYDVVVHTYIMDYDGKDAYAYWSYDYEETGEIKFYDPHNIKRSELSSQDGTFCIVFTVEGLDQAENGYSFIIDYNKDAEGNEGEGEPGDLITPAYYGRGDALTTGTAASFDAVLETYKTYHSDADDTGCEAAKLVAGQYFLYNTAINTTAFDEETQMNPKDPDSVFKGQILGVFGYQMADGIDTLDITDALKVRARDSSTYFMEIYDVDVNIMNNHQIVAYNSIDHAFEEISKKTMFTMPEWGLAPESTEPTEVTYTYTKADGSSEQVTAASGTEPTPPDNTATTCVSDGNGNHTTTTYSWPAWEDGVTEYTEVATPVTEACTMVEKTPQVDATHTTTGTTAVMECSVCGYTTGGETIPANADAHSYTEVERVESTCSTQGYVKYQCECGDSYTTPLELDSSNHEDVVTDEAVAATCTTTGLTEGSHCAACGETIVKQEVIDALDHDYQVTSSTDATCCTEGTVTYECSRCHDIKVETGVLDPTNHADYGTTEGVDAKEATRGENGYTGNTVCNGCGAILEYGEVIPALGVQITVTTNELGTTTINGEATTGEAQKVDYAKDYTLVATANEGAEFVGWSVNGKIVSTNATYTTTAYADTTYVPVFSEADAETFTVTFVDQFNKVVDTIDSTELASLEALPTAPTYMGYTFDSWSLSLDDVKALTEATIVIANYTKDELSFDVSASNCTITVDGKEYENTASVGFDAKVTVTPKSETATSWTVNGATVAYGESYTFYVTSDVTVAYGTDAVTAKPTVTAVSAEQLESDDRYVRFLATRSVPEGYTLVESGYIYGKGMTEDDLILDNVGTVQGTANGTVKLSKNGNTAGDGQFAITYGVSAKDATACARAYMIVKNSEGVAEVCYADAQIFTYPQA